MTVSVFALATVLGAACGPGEFIRKGRRAAPPQDDLLVHWELDETEGEIVCDSSDNANDGELSGSQLWHPIGGRFLGTLELDGASSLTFASTAATTTSGRMTVAMWLRVSSSQSGLVPLFASEDQACGLWLNADASALAYRCAGAELNSDVVELTDGKWHHIASAHNGTRLLLYVDSELLNTVMATTPVSQSNRSIHIGMIPGSGGAGLTGLIDDVVVYDRALSAAEVAALAADTQPPLPDTEEPALAVEQVWVRGTFADASGVASVTFNGQPATIEPDGGFEVLVPLETQSLAVVVVATDLFGNVSETTMHVDRATQTCNGDCRSMSQQVARH